MPAPNAEKAIDVKDLTAVILRRRWLLIIPLIVVTGLAYGGSYLLQPKYRSSTIVWIDRPSNVSRELISLIGADRTTRESDQQQRRELQALQNEITSQNYLYQLIRDLSLDNDPGLTRRAAGMQQENPDLSLENLKYQLLLDQLRDQISVAIVGTDHIELTVESTIPTQARDMVQRLTEILELEKTKYELERILDNQNFADLQLQKTEHSLQQAMDSLSAAQSRLSTLRLPENISSQSNRREILSDIDKTSLEITDYTEQLQRLFEQLADIQPDRIRLKYSDAVVGLRAEIDGQVAMFATMMEKYAWIEQNVSNVNIRLNDNTKLLERELAAAVDEQFASYPDDQRQILKRYFIIKENLDILKSKRSQLQLSLAKIDERINKLPNLVAEITELERDVEEARKYRDAFRSEGATVAILSERARERTKYKIIEPARIPLAPFWPDRTKIVALGLLMGLIIGGAVVLLTEMLDHSFKRVEEVTTELQLPVLATIPRIERMTFGK
ncbi:MAG TPA: Wzz/FepE/Etk N-terminal domain-containing protein [Candidatus Deferrimicrobium sp.]|nr:Wzz/FepE/Etk N-terminal domain-containing protein [Candidatus Deferrimicrobium sp.]